MELLPEPVFISGPMTGLPDKNIKAFREMEDVLRMTGHIMVENPAINETPRVEMPWSYYMRAGIAQLMRCQSIVMLPGWKASQGAVIERQIAKWLGMTIVEMHEVVDVEPNPHHT
jgi:hypothetical protein